MDSDAERRGWRGGMEVRGPREPQRTEQGKRSAFSRNLTELHIKAMENNNQQLPG